MRTPLCLRYPFDLRDFPRLLGRMAPLSLILFLLPACGAPARTDFDLNRGQAVEGESSVLADETFGEPIDEQNETWQYLIQGGDELEIVFFTHPEQNRFVKVRPDGYITLPYVGDVFAEGKAPTQLGQELMKAYANVLIQPQVDVIVQRMGARFYVLGEVARPGEFPYERRLDILQAIAGAGGYRDSAKLNNIVLLRRGRNQDEAFAAVLNLREFMGADRRRPPIELRPYDIVWVPRSAISRWDNATKQLLTGLIQVEDLAIKGWGLAKFDEVYQNRRF